MPKVPAVDEAAVVDNHHPRISSQRFVAVVDAVDVVAAADLLEVDETDLVTDATADFSDNFSNTPDFGADGAGSIDSV